MSKKLENAAAAKARKQKIILIVGSVLLLGVAALQGPKLLKHGGSPATPAAEATAAAATAATSVATPVAATPAGFKTVGTVAGVALPGGAHVVVAKNQLASFTLFEVKDPFEPQAGDAGAAGATTGATGSDTTTTPAPSATGGTPAATGSTPASTPPPAPAKLNYATIKVDGKKQEVAIGDSFPKSDPVFVLKSVKKDKATIGVAGGSFDGGQSLTLVVGKKVTVMNSATSVSYVLLLVSTESVAASFTAPTDAATASAGTPATGTTTPTTTAAATP